MTIRDALASDPRNLRLVQSIALRVHSRLPGCFDLADLIAEGNLALLKAAECYAPAAHGGTPFSAFARQRIHGAMIETCRRARYVEQTRESISVPLIAGEEGGDEADGSPETFRRISRALVRAATRPVLDGPIDRARLNRRISNAIAALSEMERQVLSVCYADDEPHWRERARRLGLSPGRIKAVRARAIANLRTRLIPNTPRPRAELPRAA